MIDMTSFNKLPVEELIGIYNKHNKSEVLDIIIKKNKGLVYKISSRFKSNKHVYEDIVQVAFTGLLVAIHRFDINQGNKFSTYAYYCIKGEIQHFLRNDNIINIPRWLKKLNNLFDTFTKNFESEKERYPTKSEISSGMNISRESIDEILKAREASFYNCSLDNYPGKDDYSIDKNIIRSKTPKNFELVMEDKILLWDAIDRLKGLNRKIIVLKYILGFSQEEIGRKVGISQRTVSRNIQNSIETLRKTMV